MRKNNAFRRAAALMAALSITVSLAAPAFAGTYYIDNGDITVTKNADGSQTVLQNGSTQNDSGEIIITTTTAAISTLESDLEGPAAEDSGFGPVVEDNYQPAQPESTEEQEAADQHESAEQAQPQQAAPAAAPGFLGNTITAINNAVNKVLNLTLKDVKIDVSNDGKAALSVQGDGDVTIELDGNNQLKSGQSKAGLEKNISAGTLTLKDDNKEAGSLTATGGFSGAGIGGSAYNGTNNITITGGKVTAVGGSSGAGIGGGGNSNGENITINGGEINATGGKYAAGIGGGSTNVYGNGADGKNITINGGTVNAAGGESGAGIGGGLKGSGSNVTVSGAAQVTTTAGKRDNRFGAGATIGNGGNTPGGELADGEEIQADISGLTTGYIHHIINNPDGSLKKEWWEFGPPQPTPDGESLDLHVETLKGAPLLFNTRQQGNTLRVTTDNLSARLHGTRQALETLQEQGVEQIQFVTTLKTTTLSVAELLAEGGSWFALEHDGLVSRRLSAAQAESLKCQVLH